VKQSAPRNRASFCWRPATSTAPLTKRPTESTRNGRRGMRPRPDQWTGEHQGELGGAQHPTQCVGLAPAEVGEGDVGVPGVFARKAPFGLSVPDQNDFVPGHVVIQSQSEPSRLWVSAGPQLPR
jgi:hypothetical protein